MLRRCASLASAARCQRWRASATTVVAAGSRARSSVSRSVVAIEVQLQQGGELGGGIRARLHHEVEIDAVEDFVVDEEPAPDAAGGLAPFRAALDDDAEEQRAMAFGTAHEHHDRVRR